MTVCTDLEPLFLREAHLSAMQLQYKQIKCRLNDTSLGPQQPLNQTRSLKEIFGLDVSHFGRWTSPVDNTSSSESSQSNLQAQILGYHMCPTNDFGPTTSLLYF
ncbi:hypothetical protein PHYBLDRAFT_139217 [Phycomyces blakesleeanus NRRL 1555(-)]|uniref:Uncharacterized protein n=1 Tax=Phycomyces blakesleeanus (strain ATCC 8743b / DSM 1359 / FGSC 10004 / NBRC 33097 / NRRL 1555) TaxID=763407 RepID=A0A162V0E9_PHYB8|nr:hypothetical protein PHYBLDRAFT_139217 [Phycomyces blakesleeanus NRRL 1555(-)]OAD79182.1 hypothetical protein PHYBLDRAFT_139217 [Phycomyces blakesleeanus NRRL 1555(-)]|eukprot:XP_018297222.1 hypothetical protein PHYBLDRAFT_139217 [Phycomyces blakesleeanus NRRL 1555(-)]